MRPLLSISSAAKAVNVPAGPLEKVALAGGFIIKVGSAARIHPDELPEIIELCRVQPKVPAPIAGSKKGRKPVWFIRDDGNVKSRPAQTAAAKLTRSSPNKSLRVTAPVVPLRQAK